MATDNTPISEGDDLFDFDGTLARPLADPVGVSMPETQVPRTPGAALPKPQPAPTMSTAEPVKSRATPTKPLGAPLKSAAPIASEATPAGPLPVEPRAAPVHTAPAHTATPPSAAPGQIGQVRPVAPWLLDTATPAALTPGAGMPAGRRRVGALTVAALLVATLLNAALVGVVWRSMTGMGDALREVGDHVAHANDIADAKTPNKLETWQDDSILAPAAEDGELALSMARAEILQGEFEHARMRLFSLLSVLDRFDAKSRPGLASRAQVLAADAFREQADAIEREAAAHSAGVRDAPKEEHR